MNLCDLPRDIIGLILDRLVVVHAPLYCYCGCGIRMGANYEDHVCDDIKTREVVANSHSIKAAKVLKSAKYRQLGYARLGLPPLSHRLIWIVQLRLVSRVMNRRVQEWRLLRGHASMMKIETRIRMRKTERKFSHELELYASEVGQAAVAACAGVEKLICNRPVPAGASSWHQIHNHSDAVRCCKLEQISKRQFGAIPIDKVRHILRAGKISTVMRKVEKLLRWELSYCINVNLQWEVRDGELIWGFRQLSFK